MEVLIGMDEAGYGPNLGPLVVAATAWGVEEGSGFRVQGSEEREARESRGGGARAQSLPGSGTTRLAAKEYDSCEIDLYRTLRAVVARGPDEKRIGIADSKILYRPGLGLRQLERGVHAAQFCLRQMSGCWSDLISHCEADPDSHVRNVPWHNDFNCALPMDAVAEELSDLGEQLLEACDAAGVRPIAIRARLVFPAEFNGLTDRYGSKGAALSHVTVGLLREVIDRLDCESHLPAKPGSSIQPPAPSLQSPIFVVCDKHGGRNYYGALLQHHFPEHWIEPVREGARESRYEWGPAESRTRVSFRVGGEAFLPTALASMTAKYLRELAMRAFNEYWCARVPGLKPTAGYPLDARRFRKDIAAVQRELGMEDHVLWRNR
jgi:hypothetical protein